MMFAGISRKRRILYIYLFFATTFGLITLYLLFFNVGLALKNPVSKEGTFSIDLTNTSTHKITDIKVYYIKDQNRHLIFNIDELMPNEAVTIPLKREYSENGKIRLIAEAPYHKTVVKELSLGQIRPSNVQLEISAPRAFFVNLTSEISLNACNISDELADVIIVLEAPKALISAEKEMAKFKLLPKECKKVSFTVKPSAAGDTTIYFNLVANNIAEKYPLHIVIYEAE